MLGVCPTDVPQQQHESLCAGEVGSPGRYAFESHLIILDALALVGGLKDFAARKRIVVIRQEG